MNILYYYKIIYDSSASKVRSMKRLPDFDNSDRSKRMRRFVSRPAIIRRIYDMLLDCYGEQGWWPLVSRAEKKGFDAKGYHKGAYTWPRTGTERFEIIIGAILTQNTAWKNVETVLIRLMSNGLFSPRSILEYPVGALTEMLKPCGYYNQKTKKIRIAAEFFAHLDGKKLNRVPERRELLTLWGIGKETADSILLYAFRRPFFVVDAYTERIFSRLCLVPRAAEYDEIRMIFEASFPADADKYNEYHALIVAHAKASCTNHPDCESCPIAALCKRCIAPRA
jgi:endonuclease-3 related protein